MKSLRHLTRPGRVLTALGLGLALSATATACKKNKGSNVPRGLNQKEVEKQRQQVQEQARLAGLLDLARDDLAKGRYISALHRGEEALAKDPKNANAHVVIGAALWRAGDLEKSTEAYRKGLEIDAQNYPAALGLSRNLQALGNHTEAMSLQDSLIAEEGKNFKEVKCDEESQCEEGWCDVKANMCKAPRQMGPRLTKLWSQYLLLDVKGGLQSGDEIFLGGVGEDSDQAQVPIAQAYIAFLRAFESNPDLVQVEGDTGEGLLALDMTQGLKHTLGEVGGKEGDIVINEVLTEARISPAMVKKLKLKELAKIKPLGGGDDTPEQVVVLIPSVKIGDMTIKNVPAFVQDLATMTLADEPSVVLGRQVLQRLGAVSFDFQNRKMVLSKSKPSGAPDGAAEVPLAFLDMRVLNVPASLISIDGSEHRFWTWFGGIWGSGLALSQKHYLKSGHRPADLAEVEYPDQGLDTVFIKSIDLGENGKIPGVGGYVFMNTPPDPTLQQVVDNTGFELGGYFNLTVLQHHVVTFVPQDGVIYIAPTPAG